MISIERWAFNACSSLTTIDIPESVTSIGTYVFKDCVSLTTINISENSQLMSIGSYACAGCSSLTSIVLPKILETVNSEAFANCPKLFDVFCHADKLPSTKANAFDGSYPEYATLHVPANALNDYKNTVPWSSFGTIVTVTTDIKNPERTTQDSPFIYDLRGHRVTDLTKGIYIIGGHKVMVKD